MHIDARNIPNHAELEGDVCIVGAGAAGISMALDWMDSGHKVILLEGGGFEYDDQVQELYAGKTSGQKYYPLKSARLHYFGGTTGHWAGLCSPFDPIDFEKRDWIPLSGWPITRKELDPFYARANQKLKLGPYEYNVDYWQKENPKLVPFPLDSSVVYSKLWQSSTARFNALYKDQIVKAKNVHLYTYANVVDIKTNEPISSIDHVVIKNHAGKTHTVKAKHFILACCAVQNARLLLASNSQTPHGLGNDHDNVGRYFMEHLEISAAELWLFKPFPTDLYSWEYGTTKPVAELAIAPAVQREHKITNGTASLIPLKWGRNAKPRIETWQNEDPRKSEETMFKDMNVATEKSKSETQLGIDNAFELDIRIEQSPNPDSRVTLAQDKDALGVPRVHLNWALTSLDKRSIRTIFQIIGQEFGRAGLGRVKLMDYLRDANDNSWPAFTNAGWHHMGTTRMSDDPKTGVVDANCKVHGIENLYVAGSGCYTTAAAPNPTLTVVALSLRLSDHVRSKLG